MKHGFLVRILTTYSLIVFLVLSILFGLYLSYAQRQTQDRIEESDTASFINYVNSSEEIFEIMNDVSAAVRSLNSVDLFAYSSGDTYYERLTRVFGDLSTINLRLATRNIQIFVHKMSDDTVISNASSLPISRFAEELGIQLPVYRAALMNVPSSLLRGGRYLLTDRHVVHLASKDYIDSRIIVAVIAEASRFSMRVPAPGMYSSFFTRSDANLDLRTARPVVSDAVRFAEKEGGEGEPGRLRVGPVTYKWIDSRFLDLRYYYSIDESASSRRSVLLVMNMLLAFVAANALAVIVIAIFSIRLFRPVERLIDSLTSLGIDGDSTVDAKNEFDRLSAHVIEIRRSNQELVRKVEDGNRLSRNALLHGIVAGSYDPNLAAGELRRQSLDWLEQDCVVVAFEIAEEGGAPSSARSWAEEVARVLHEQLGENFPLEPLSYRPLSPCFAVRCGDEAVLKEKIAATVSAVETALGLRMCAFIGPVSRGLKELRASLAAAYRLLDHRNLNSIKSVYDSRDLEGLVADFHVYSSAVELQLIGAVEKNDFPEAKRLLAEIFDGFDDASAKDVEELELFVSALAATYCRAMRKTGVVHDANARGFYRSLHDREDAATLRDAAIEGFERLFLAADEARHERFDKLKEDLEFYIRNNLHRNISLLDVAEAFNLSTNYMSYLFKNAVNENFKDYLARCRFEVASAILRERPTIRLADLAERVGMTNVNTLIRLFHRYGGSAPGRFLKDAGR